MDTKRLSEAKLSNVSDPLRMSETSVHRRNSDDIDDDEVERISSLEMEEEKKMD
jgi:hypothetical protein